MALNRFQAPSATAFIVNEGFVRRSQMKGLAIRFVREDEGQDLIEYALLATVIALVVFVGASAAGTSLNTWYANISTTVDNWAALALK